MKNNKTIKRRVLRKAKRNQSKILKLERKAKQAEVLKKRKKLVGAKVVGSTKEVHIVNKQKSTVSTKKYVKNTKVRYTKATIDSINFSSPLLTSIFFHNENYSFETIKRGKMCNNYRWKSLFGGSLFNKVNGRWVSPFTEAYAIHNHIGATIPLKIHARNKKSPTVEFAGLHRYDRRSELLKMTLWDLFPSLQDTQIKRIDVAIDVDKRVQSKVHKALTRKRIAKRYKNSIYYKTQKEGKRNPIVNIIIYDKGKKEGFKLDNKLIRLEFQFAAGYFPKITLRNIDQAITKIEKRMKRDTGLNIKVCPLL